MHKDNYFNRPMPSGTEETGELEHLRKLFIGGLSPMTNEDSLKQFYEQWGDVTDVVVMRDPATKRSRGFGFISFAKASMVDQAQLARPHTIDGKTVDAKRALPRPELDKPESNASVKKVFVGGLKEVHDEASLEEYFQQFGNVVGVKILTDKATGRKRGFAFVEFDDYDAVDKAVLKKNHTIKYVFVDVKKSVYKQEVMRKHQLQQAGAGGIAPQNNGQYGMGGNMPPQPQGYANNGWGMNSYPNAYSQPPPAAPVPPQAYNYQPQASANGWNNGPPAYNGGWNQNQGYGAPTTVPPQGPPAAAAPPTNWTGGNNFGSEYQQAYNGGPTKAGNLGGNRMNPYGVTAGNNYGNIPQATYGSAQGYFNSYSTQQPPPAASFTPIKGGGTPGRASNRQY